MGEGDRAPTSRESAWIEAHLERFEAARRALPTFPVPSFAYLEVARSRSSSGREGPRGYLLGPETSLGAEVEILDWRRAPLAEVFFGYEEGDTFEVGTRSVEGEVLERALFTVRGEALVEIRRGDQAFTRSDAGWRVRAGALPPPLAARTGGRGNRVSASQRAPLDAAQSALVDLPRERSVLVLGEAGFGKTTVALHRLAALQARAHAEGRRFRALVVCPTPGLVRLSRRILERLGAVGVEVRTFEDWILRAARRAFPGLPERVSRDARLGVLRLKRHPVLREALPAIAARRLPGGKHPGAVGRADLLHLFGDRARMEAVQARASGELSRHAVEEVLEHTHVQFSRTSEHEHAHVDAERLATLDARAIDEGTPLGDAETFDVEDCAVLFELQRLRTGTDAAPDGKFRHYDHIVIDEAQELAPIELAILGRARTKDGSLTVAGDENQQTDDTAAFWSAARIERARGHGGARVEDAPSPKVTGSPALAARGSAALSLWHDSMIELGVPEYEAAVLLESYRCPEAVTAFARSLLDPATREFPDPPVGSALRLSRPESPVARLALLIESLRDLERRDPGATIAVVCPTEDAARERHRQLARGLLARLALDGDFDFRPGVVVTSVAEVRGLEFDFVVAPEVRAPAALTRAERRALYVAVTRAIHQVWILVSEEPSASTPAAG